MHPHLKRWLALAVLISGLTQAGGAGRPVSALQELPAPRSAGKALLTALAVNGSGAPVLAWTEQRPGKNRELRAALFAKNVWTPLGGVLNEGRSFNAAQLTARTGPGGQVWLGWSEDAGIAHVDSYLMSGWNGKAWSSPSEYAVRRNLSDASRSRSFALLPNGTPTLAWTDLGVRGAWAGVVRPLWRQGGTWIPQTLLSDPGRAGFSPDIAVNRTGRRTVAFLEGDFATMNVRVTREGEGGTWRALGGPLNRRPKSFAASPRVLLTAVGTPLVAWIEEDASGHDRVHISRWTGQGWEAVGGPASSAGAKAEDLAFALTRSGAPLLAWLEAGQLRAARWNGGGWAALPLPTIQKATGPSLSANGEYLGVSDAGRLRVWRLR